MERYGGDREKPLTVRGRPGANRMGDARPRAAAVGFGNVEGRLPPRASPRNSRRLAFFAGGQTGRGLESDRGVFGGIVEDRHDSAIVINTPGCYNVYCNTNHVG